MTNTHERLYLDAPYAQAQGALERRLGLWQGRGDCTLTLVAPVNGRDVARTVTAHAEQIPGAANYTVAYYLRWKAGDTASGIPTPGFSGTLTLSAGEDYHECSLLLDGAYEPPGGLPGVVFDQLLGRRIAHSTLTGLLEGVAQELQREHTAIEAAKHPV